MLNMIIGLGFGVGVVLLGAIAWYAREAAKNTEAIKDFVEEIDLDRLDDIISEVEQIDLDRLDNLVANVEDVINEQTLGRLTPEMKVSRGEVCDGNCNTCEEVHPDCGEEPCGQTFCNDECDEDYNEDDEEDWENDWDEEDDDYQSPLEEALCKIKEVWLKRNTFEDEDDLIAELEDKVEDVVDSVEYSVENVEQAVELVLSKGIITNDELKEIVTYLVDSDVCIEGLDDEELSQLISNL